MMRAVVSLGLHRDGALFGIDDPLLDQRRACFYECLASDHQQSLILGRPYALTPAHFDTQLPTGQGLRWSHQPNPDGEQGVFFICKWKLIPTMRRIAELGLIKSVGYDGSPLDLPRSFFKLMCSSAVRALDSDLAKFVDELPPELQYQTYDRSSQGYRPQCSRLTMQAHHCAVLINESLLNLHRRHFTEALAASREEPLLSPYADSILAISLQACTIIPEVVEAAQDMYSTLSKRQCVNPYTTGEADKQHRVCIPQHASFRLRCMVSVSAQMNRTQLKACFSQATLVIRAPASLLAPHAMSVLFKALTLLEAAATESQLAAELVVRLRKLHSQASQVYQSPAFRSPDHQGAVSLPSRIAEKLAQLNPKLSANINKTSPPSVLQPQTQPDSHLTQTQSGRISPGLTQPM